MELGQEVFVGGGFISMAMIQSPVLTLHSSNDGGRQGQTGVPKKNNSSFILFGDYEWCTCA